MQTAYGEPSKSVRVQTVPFPAFDESSDKLLLRVKAVSVDPLYDLFVKGSLKIGSATPSRWLSGTTSAAWSSKPGVGRDSRRATRCTAS